MEESIVPITRAIKQYRNASLNIMNPPISVLYFLNRITNKPILMASPISIITNGIAIPTGLKSATYIIRNKTIETAPNIRPDFNAELKSVFFDSIANYFKGLFSAKVRNLIKNHEK
jgi:hypothetical protein